MKDASRSSFKKKLAIFIALVMLLGSVPNLSGIVSATPLGGGGGGYLELDAALATPASFTITFVDRGEVIAVRTVTRPDRYLLLEYFPQIFRDDGHLLRSWNTIETPTYYNQGEFLAPWYVIEADWRVYAQWYYGFYVSINATGGTFENYWVPGVVYAETYVFVPGVTQNDFFTIYYLLYHRLDFLFINLYRPGHRFVGWEWGNMEMDALITQPMTFYAIWERLVPNTFTVTFIAWEEIIATVLVHGPDFILAEEDIPEISPREGWIIHDWGSHDLQLWHWEIGTITTDLELHLIVLYGFFVYFDANGGTFQVPWSIDPVPYAGIGTPWLSVNEYYTIYFLLNQLGLLTTPPTRPAHRFIGWDTGGLGMDDFVPHPMTFYAQWERLVPNTFTVTFTAWGEIITTVLVHGPDFILAEEDIPEISPRDGWIIHDWGSHDLQLWHWEIGTITTDLELHLIVMYGFFVYFDANGGTFQVPWSIDPVPYAGIGTPWLSVNEYYTIYFLLNQLGLLTAPPTRPAHRFIGWDTGGLSMDDFVPYPMTFYAQWEVADYFVITFVDRGEVVAVRTVTRPDHYLLWEYFPRLVRDDGHLLRSWNTVQSPNYYNQGEFLAPWYVIETDWRVYAQWYYGFYLSMNANGGTFENYWVTGVIYTERDVFVPGATQNDFFTVAHMIYHYFDFLFINLQRPGHRFIGWDIGDMEMDDLITQPTTFYAQWERLVPNTFTVTFTAWGEVISTVLVHGPDFILAEEDIPEISPREGWVIHGWRSYDPAPALWIWELETITSDMRFYVGGEYGFNVYFYANGGTFRSVWTLDTIPLTRLISPWPSINEYHTVDFLIYVFGILYSQPIRPGHRFTGWYTAEFKPDDFLTQTITFYAQWEAADYFILTFVDRGEVIAVQTVTAPDFILMYYEFPETPTQDSYLMTGWHPIENYPYRGWGMTPNPGWGFPIVQDMRLYAQWHYGFNLFLDANGGTFENYWAPGSIYSRNHVFVPGPTQNDYFTVYFMLYYLFDVLFMNLQRPGYRFIGWDTGGLALDNFITSPITFYAQWQRIQQPSPPTPPAIPPTPQPSPDPAPPAAPVPPVQEIQPDDGASISVGDIYITVTVENGEAIVHLTDAEMVTLVSDAQAVVMDFTGEYFNDAVNITLPAALFEVVGESDLVLEVVMPQGTLSFSPGAVASAAEQADGVPISLSLEQMHLSEIPNHQRRYVRGNDYIFSIAVMAGESPIRNFDGSINVTVSFNGRLPATVWFLDYDGILHPRTATHCAVTSTVTFVTNHFSLFVIQEADEWLNPFIDVQAAAPYFSAVRFVNEQGLFLGTAADLFSPNQTMTRAMMTTVLWRMAGEPIVGGFNNTFTDVASGSFYYTPVMWAASQGIVVGVGNNAFNPHGNVTLRQAITIINRFAMQFNYVPLTISTENRNDATRAEIAMIFYEFEQK